MYFFLERRLLQGTNCVYNSAVNSEQLTMNTCSDFPVKTCNLFQTILTFFLLSMSQLVLDLVCFSNKYFGNLSDSTNITGEILA